MVGYDKIVLDEEKKGNASSTDSLTDELTDDEDDQYDSPKKGNKYSSLLGDLNDSLLKSHATMRNSGMIERKIKLLSTTIEV